MLSQSNTLATKPRRFPCIFGLNVIEFLDKNHVMFGLEDNQFFKKIVRVYDYLWATLCIVSFYLINDENFSVVKLQTISW